MAIDIKGMTCELCPIAIKKDLSEVEGVTKVKISFKEKPGWVTVEGIKKPGAYSEKV